jgi:hypothetical protein
MCAESDEGAGAAEGGVIEGCEWGEVEEGYEAREEY